MSIADEIERLKAQHAAGTLTDAEFAAAKARLLGGERQEGDGKGRAALSYALWTLVIVVFLGAAALLVLVEEMNQTLRTIAGVAAMAAGTLGAGLAIMEEMGPVAIGGLGLGAAVLGLIAFAAVGPVILLAVLPILAVGAMLYWFANISG